MKTSVYTIILSLLLAPCFTFAAEGHEGGNGGDVIQCFEKRVMRLPDNKAKEFFEVNYKLLDHYEAEQKGIEIDLGPKSLSVDEKIDIALNRLKRLDVQRYWRYKVEVGRFYENTRFLPDVELTDIPDSHHIAIPEGCKIVQAAIQRKPQFDEDKYFTIDEDIWVALDNDTKAGLILHEIILKENTSWPSSDENSIQSRYFNSIISSPKFESITKEKYRQMMRWQIGMSRYYGWIDERNNKLYTEYRDFGYEKNKELGLCERIGLKKALYTEVLNSYPEFYEHRERGYDGHIQYLSVINDQDNNKSVVIQLRQERPRVLKKNERFPDHHKKTLCSGEIH